ncbi:MAG: hypothetical protein JW820_09310 [Spirochaetales bacterium]|nr:hypothetical protein [Spirochaetales bacterium]
MKSLHDFLGELTGLLEEAGIPYMLTGSIASTFYGRPRATQDVDLVVDPNAQSLTRFVRSATARAYYIDDQDAREALERRSMFNLIDTDSGYKLDLILRKERPYSVEEFARRRPTTISGVRAYVVSPEDAILSKLEWAREGGSERQFLDALGIAVIQRRDLDLRYLRRWAGELNVSDVLERLLRERDSAESR